MVKLNERHQKIINLLQGEQLSSVEIARKLSMKSASISRSLMFLKENGIVREMMIINPASFGHQYFEVCFSTCNSQKTSRAELIQNLTETEQVALVAETGGDYEVVIGVLAKSVVEINSLFEKLEKRHGAFLAKKTLSVSLNFLGFGLKCLNPTSPRSYRREPRTSRMINQLDEKDHRVLHGLNKEGASSARIARAVGLSDTSFRHRVRRLKEKGVITGLIYAVDSSQVAHSLYVFQLALNSNCKTFRDTLIDFCKEHPNIIQANELLGPFDFKLGVAVFAPSEVSKIQDEIKRKFKKNIQELSVIPMLKYHRINTYPFKKCPT
jgi:Lrp/AsnC family leucine-responsive transcriptional regulator